MLFHFKLESNQEKERKLDHLGTKLNEVVSNYQSVYENEQSIDPVSLHVELEELKET